MKNYSEEEVKQGLVNFLGRHPDISLRKFEAMTVEYSGRRVSPGKLSLLTADTKHGVSQLKRAGKSNPWVLESVMKTIERFESKRELPVKTTSFEAILAICEASIGDGSMHVIVGESGTGKTTAFREHAARHPEVIAITARKTMRQRALLHALCNALGTHYFVRKSPDDLLMEMVEVAPKQIVIDEADMLSSGPMESLRTIHDLAGTSVILFGMPRIIKRLTMSSMANEAMPQVYSRINLYKTLAAPSAQDMRSIIHYRGIQKKDVVDEIVKLSTAGGVPNLHRTDELVKELKRACAANSMKLDDIQVEWVRDIRREMPL